MGKFGFACGLALVWLAATAGAPHAAMIQPGLVLCPTGAVSNDAPVRAERCDPRRMNQQWTLDRATSELRLDSSTNKMCMDVAGKLILPAVNVVVYDCNGQHNQKWEFMGAELRVKGGRFCLTLPSWDEKEQFKIYECDRNRWGGLQRWHYAP